MAQYFDNNPELKSNIRYLDTYICGRKLTFKSDTGVFSNKEIDFGSSLLVKYLLNLEKVDSLCDLGCGYGFIGVTLAIFDKANKFCFIDVNIKACNLTKENLDKYGLTNYTVYENDGLEGIDQEFDLIIFNPPIRAGKKIIYKLFQQSYDKIKEKGKLIIVIRKDLGAESAYRELSNYFKKVMVVEKHKGYYIIEASK